MLRSSASFSTSLSLIRRARAVDPEAWEILLQLYGPLIYSWGRRMGLQGQDAGDLMQNVFVSVWRGLPKFDAERPDASFRGWLRTITRNAAYEQARKKRVEILAGEQLQDVVDPATAQTLTDASEDDLFDRLPQRALEIVRECVDETTWTAFWRVTVEDHLVPDVARELAMSAAAVRQARYRVLCRLRELLADH